MFLSNPEYIRFHPVPPRIVFLLRSSLFACCYAPKKKIQKYLAGEREGFSLVELIIVIAIMAILIGVIALAVIPNIQRSRESKDLTTLDNILSATNVAIANLKITADGGGEYTSGSTDKVVKAVYDELGEVSLGSSAATKNNAKIFIKYVVGTGSTAAKITVKAATGADADANECEYSTKEDGTSKQTFEVTN